MHLPSHATSRPVLRLVGETPHRAAPPSARGVRAGRREAEERLAQVRRENHAAALRFDLDPNDPRLILAARTQAELQGAALPADRRRRLLSLAHRLGLRPFDANLVIAIVQDQARGGSEAGPLAERLRIVPSPGRVADPVVAADQSRAVAGQTPSLAAMALGALLAGALLWCLLRWIEAG